METVIFSNFQAEVDKVAGEAGAARGEETFGEFGAAVGREAGITAGRKVAIQVIFCRSDM